MFFNTVCVVWFSQETHNFKLTEACQLSLIAVKRFLRKIVTQCYFSRLAYKGHLLEIAF